MEKQRGISLVGLIVVLVVLGFLGLMAAKLLPVYLEYFGVKKMLTAMQNTGELQGSVLDIRKAYQLRNAIEDVKSVKAEDLEITNEAGETVVSANWSVKVPMFANVSACLDFSVTTAK